MLTSTFSSVVFLSELSVLSVALPSAFTGVLCLLFFRKPRIGNKKSVPKLKEPSTPSSLIPIISNIWNFLFNGEAFYTQSTYRKGFAESFGFTTIFSKVYFLVEPESIQALWKASYSLPRLSTQIFCLKILFNMPTKALAVYRAENPATSKFSTSHGRKLLKNQIHDLTHTSLMKFLNGDGLHIFYQHWARNFIRNLRKLPISDQWVEFPDMMAFFDQEWGAALIEAECGPLLAQLFPSFPADIAEYDRIIPDLIKSPPRWFKPGVYRTREKVYDSILAWHKFARANFDPKLVNPEDGYDPFWGSSFIRERQEIHGSIKDFDHEAAAASDLGFIWASATNVTPSSMWAIVEVFKDPTLLSRVRAEPVVHALGDDLSTLINQPQPLFTSPLLQAIYAENIRYYTKAYITRMNELEDLNVGKWRIPRNSVVVVSSAQGMMNPQGWNEGPDNKHPVTSFWPDRFLYDPANPQSGPSRPEHRPKSRSIPSDMKPEKPEFSLDGIQGFFIPYGGGPSMCPGRYFTKRAMIATICILASQYDVELLGDAATVGMDTGRFYGYGSQRPKGTIPFRIRKRQT